MTIDKINTQHSLTKEQKQAIGLLSIGTFLEYFDIMLYVHMAILLNELFFPKYDPHVASLLAAFAFCSTYLMRPIGAFIFGYIGDNIGRKTVVVITTFMMAFSSIVMFFLPTYAQIGITASIIVTLCRMFQGMSSMGEMTGATLYLTELIQEPKNYAAVACVKAMANIGTFVALLVGVFTIKYGLNWRFAFLFGATIAIVGTIARSTLRETADFVDAKKRVSLKTSDMQSKPINKKVALAYFLMEAGWPIWVYVTYIHYGGVLKNDFNYTAIEVLQHNLYIAAWGVVVATTLVFLATRINPLKIMRIRAVIFVAFLGVFILNLENSQTLLNITLLQIFIKTFNPVTMPGDAIIFKYFPILKRFFATSMLYALSRLFMYITTAFGTVYLTKYFGTYGLLVLIAPVMIGYFYGLNLFRRLEEKEA
jgi:MHS family proline/betaine transporter-like MFS transporter